jgi:hypothetical protein
LGPWPYGLGATWQAQVAPAAALAPTPTGCGTAQRWGGGQSQQPTLQALLAMQSGHLGSLMTAARCLSFALRALATRTWWAWVGTFGMCAPTPGVPRTTLTCPAQPGASSPRPTLPPHAQPQVPPPLHPPKLNPIGRPPAGHLLLAQQRLSTPLPLARASWLARMGGARQPQILHCFASGV